MDIWRYGGNDVKQKRTHTFGSNFKYLIFSRPLAFCKKAVERVNSEKNILNSSVKWFF